MNLRTFLVASLSLLFGSGLSAQVSYKPFKAKPTCTLTGADQDAGCSEESKIFTAEIRGLMGADRVGPYKIRIVDDLDPRRDKPLLSAQFTNPNNKFPLVGQFLALQIKFKLKCLEKTKQCLACGSSIVSFKYSVGMGWVDMKDSVTPTAPCSESRSVRMTVDFGSGKKNDNLACQLRFRCKRNYGFGCPGMFGIPEMGFSGQTTLGNVFTVELTNTAPNCQAILIVGTDNTQWLDHPLPFPVGLLIPGNPCELLVAPEVLLGTTTSFLSPGSASIPLFVPPEPQLVGLDLYFQWLISDPTAPGDPHFSMTEGLDVTIGS